MHFILYRSVTLQQELYVVQPLKVYGCKSVLAYCAIPHNYFIKLYDDALRWMANLLFKKNYHERQNRRNVSVLVFAPSSDVAGQACL